MRNRHHISNIFLPKFVTNISLYFVPIHYKYLSQLCSISSYSITFILIFNFIRHTIDIVVYVCSIISCMYCTVRSWLDVLSTKCWYQHSRELRQQLQLKFDNNALNYYGCTDLHFSTAQLGWHSWKLYFWRTFMARGQYSIFSATLLLQLNFNFFFDVHLVPDEVILCNIEKIVLTSYGVTLSGTLWASGKELRCSCSNKIALKSHSGPEPYRPYRYFGSDYCWISGVDSTTKKWYHPE